MEVKYNQNEILVFRNQGYILNVMGGEKSSEVAAIKVKTKVIFGWKRCDRKGHWRADSVLLLDLSGGYANTPFIMVCFAGMFFRLFLHVCCLMVF